ncbi:MAG: DUF87 domain-containing protein [Nanoarchaeota archaeon]|nr:DUF87 domain-containing protein [Nanoarchaeota archaeon]
MTQTYKLSIEEICNKLRPVFGKKIDEVYLKHAMAESREEREEIEHLLNALYHKHLSQLLDKKVLLEPPLEEQVSGEYKLANIVYADKVLYPFNLREKDFVRHVCISGMSGSGKTTLAFHVINNFIEKNKPFLIFDWKKSFRPLLKTDNEMMLFTVGDDSVANLFKMNINEPPKGVSPKEWINVLCDLLAESFFASYGVHKIILETLDEAFKEWGIYKGSKNYPTWNHIKWRLEEKMNKTKGREGGWIESALRIASVLTFGDFGKILNYKGENALKAENLLDKKVIFELNSLGNIEKKFFCEFILTYIYKLKKANQTKVSTGFEHAILVDEAHNIFLKDKTHFVSESVTDMIYREMREYGISLICLDQHVSKLSDTVVGNSACHIAFQQQLPNDIETISRVMQLNDKKEFFSQLPVGSAIVKLSERYSNPFLIEVEEASLRKEEITNSDIISRMQYLFQVRELERGEDEDFKKSLMQEHLMQDPKVVESIKIEEVRKPNHSLYNGDLEKIMDLSFREELTSGQKILYEFIGEKIAEGWNLDEIEKFMQERKEIGEYNSEDISKAVNWYLGKDIVTIKERQKQKLYKEKIPMKNTTCEGELSEDQGRFIAFLQANPDHELNTVELYRQVGLSARKGNKIKNELLEQGKIKIQEIKYNKGWKKIIRLA